MKILFSNFCEAVKGFNWKQLLLSKGPCTFLVNYDTDSNTIFGAIGHFFLIDKVESESETERDAECEWKK